MPFRIRTKSVDTVVHQSYICLCCLHRIQMFFPPFFSLQIGSYNDTYYLKIDARYRLDWPTSCQEPSCPKCIFPPYQPSRFAVKKSPYYLNIVAVFDVHMADSNGPGKCGRLNWMSDFQNLLAFFYAIETVNKNYLFKLSNSLQLGGVAIDTCSNPSRIGQDIYSLLSGEGLCGVGGTDEMVSFVVIFRRTIVRKQVLDTNSLMK